MGRNADGRCQEGERQQGSPGTRLEVGPSWLGHLVNIGLSKIVGITFIVIITRLARVKEEMGDKDGAEDLREEAGESFPIPS